MFNYIDYHVIYIKFYSEKEIHFRSKMIKLQLYLNPGN